MAKRSTSPTKRTLDHCRRLGWTAHVVENWIAIKGHPAGGVRRDAFGFGDVLVATGDSVLLIQATSGSNGSARIQKIKEECNDAAKMWLQSNGRIEVWAWRKLKRKVDGRSWVPRITEVTTEDL